MSLICGSLLFALTLSAQKPIQGTVITYKNLTLYPIMTGLSRKPADVITLDEGIKQGTVVISETGVGTPLIRRRQGAGSNAGVQGAGFGGGQAGFGGGQAVQFSRGGPQVNTLWLTNNSGKTLLLVAGEMLLGGHQDRIVQKDGLIPPSAKPVDLAVFCVEHGRWNGQSAQFGVAITSADPTMKGGGGGMGGGGAFAAPGGGRGAAVATRNQSDVWDKVAQQNRALGTENATGTYRENYTNAKTRPEMDESVQAIGSKFPVGEAAGVVVAVDGKLIWMDRFDTRATFAKYWPKLLKSYVLEAMAGARKAHVVPTYAEAMHWAESREGTATFEGMEGLSKLTKVESTSTVLYELEDLQTTPGIVVHANKAAKG